MTFGANFASLRCTKSTAGDELSMLRMATEAANA
jgi:hypothetical protein